MEIVGLRVNGRTERPLGVGDRTPTLSWQLNADGAWQIAYQARAAASGPDLSAGRLLWDTGKVASEQHRCVYDGPALGSRQQVTWQVRVWTMDDPEPVCSGTASWETGLLDRQEWGAARWIEHLERGNGDPLPIFARAFTVDPDRTVSTARIFLAGLGIHVVRVNGHPVTDEVLAPGNSNYQLSVEYRTYDVTALLVDGSNTVGVELGNGTAHVHRDGVTEYRRSPYSWWTSEEGARGALCAQVRPGETVVKVSGVAGYHVGGTINVDTGNSGRALESRRIVSVGTSGSGGSVVTVHPGLESDHPEGATVTGSGDPLAEFEPSAAAALTPRLIARLELTYTDGSAAAVVSGPEWKAALGPTITDNWFSGSDYDARREQPGWDEPDADLSSTAQRRDGSPTGWCDAGIAPPPNLTTELVWRAAEPVKVIDTWTPVSRTEPEPGTWVFDLGQNVAGWPELCLRDVPEGTRVTMRPAEALHDDGTVDQRSIHNAHRGTDVFHTYTAFGAGVERWRPQFQYFAMQYVQVTGLPAGYVPDRFTVRGLQLRADTPIAGGIATSDARVDRIHRMAHYSIASNMQSVLTDCPGREKLAYGADYTHPMGSLARHFDFTAYLRTMQRHLVEGQARRGTGVGNVALKTPVYDWGYTENFGDEINWGNAIILVPWILYEQYGDTRTMAENYPQMRGFLHYITNRKAGTGTDAHIVTGALGDWVASEQTAGALTGTWGYHRSARCLAQMAALLGNRADATEFGALADSIATAFQERFFDPTLRCYTGDGTVAGATQAAQALALDAGLVPDDKREVVVDALVERIRAYQPYGGGPHLSAGHIGLGPTVRALRDADRDDVLWEVLQEDTPPSYGHFLRSTTRNPGGLTTIPEQWDEQNSLNHMILLQIDEWFHTSLAGIRQAPLPGGAGYREVVIAPKVVGDLANVDGFHQPPAGTITSSWRRTGDTFTLMVHIPPNTRARVCVPGREEVAPQGAVRRAGPLAEYDVRSGRYVFVSSLA